MYVKSSWPIASHRIAPTWGINAWSVGGQSRRTARISFWPPRSRRNLRPNTPMPIVDACRDAISEQPLLHTSHQNPIRLR